MPQGCQIFLGPNIPKRGKVYQMGTNYVCTPNGNTYYTKWSIMYIPNIRKIYQRFPFQGPPKYTQIGILVTK
jgi:hypothetical protein